MIVWQEPPAFIEYVGEAEKIGRMTYVAGVCAGMGLVSVDQPGFVEITEDFKRRSILAKTDGPILDGAFQVGVDREKANVETMLNVGEEGSPGYARRRAQAVEYFGNACSDLVIDYPAVFEMAADGNE